MIPAMRNSYRFSLACALMFAFCAQAASVSFQQRTYTVSVVPLGAGVPAAGGSDLIFVILPDNTKYLCIPTDPTVRAVFDPNAQRFYKVDGFNGLIEGFSSLNSTLIKLDGTFVGARADTPGPDAYSIPLPIDPTKKADIAILDDSTIAYRTADTNVYEITRTATSIVNKTTSIPLVATGNLAVDYDIEDSTLLLVESSVTDTNKNALPDRISSYFRSGQFFDQIVLDNNPNIPGYTGNASGIAWDVDNGDIYVLDGNQLIVFTLQRANITSVNPNRGPTSGGTTVQVLGANFPADAIVFFGGVQATNIVFKSSAQINCTTPPNGLGPVDVTMTGTNIVPGSPVKLVNGYTYGNAPPVAALSASPTTGLSPLTVLFDISASVDKDGTISSRILDFGDGTTFTFPSDLTVVQTSHTYTGNNMFVATFTLTDSLGPTSVATQLITVGTGGDDEVDTLYLKTLSMKVVTTPAENDQLTVTGQFTLPDQSTSDDLQDGMVIVVVNGVTVSGDQTLGKKGRLNSKNEKFTISLVRTRGIADGTYAFRYLLKKADLSAASPTIPVGATRISLPISLTIVTGLGRQIYYGNGMTDNNGNGVPKAVVADVKQTKKGSTLSLVRK